jgi:hypothetical protein
MHTQEKKWTIWLSIYIVSTILQLIYWPNLPTKILNLNIFTISTFITTLYLFIDLQCRLIRKKADRRDSSIFTIIYLIWIIPFLSFTHQPANWIKISTFIIILLYVETFLLQRNDKGLEKS